MTIQIKTTNKIEHELTPLGMIELRKKPIKATLSRVHHPYIQLSKQQGDNGKAFYISALYLGIGDFVIIDMAGATAFKEALAIIAYHQQSTNTPLLIDDELEQSVRYFSEYSKFKTWVSRFIDEQGNEITLPMMTARKRKQIEKAQLAEIIAKQGGVE